MGGLGHESALDGVTGLQALGSSAGRWIPGCCWSTGGFQPHELLEVLNHPGELQPTDLREGAEVAPTGQQQRCDGARCPRWDSASSRAAGPGRVSKQAWDQEWVQSAGTPRKEGGSDEGVRGIRAGEVTIAGRAGKGGWGWVRAGKTQLPGAVGAESSEGTSP